MKKNDIILIAVILVLGIGAFIFFRMGGKEGAQVTITVDQKLYGTYELSKDQTIEINDTNTLKIENGQAKMVEADCPDGLCLRQHAISKDNETIVCLPNKIVVEVIGGAKKELDASLRP